MRLSLFPNWTSLFDIRVRCPKYPARGACLPAKGIVGCKHKRRTIRFFTSSHTKGRRNCKGKMMRKDRRMMIWKENRADLFSIQTKWQELPGQLEKISVQFATHKKMVKFYELLPELKYLHPQFSNPHRHASPNLLHKDKCEAKAICHA